MSNENLCDCVNIKRCSCHENHYVSHTDTKGFDIRIINDPLYECILQRCYIKIAFKKNENCQHCGRSTFCWLTFDELTPQFTLIVSDKKQNKYEYSFLEYIKFDPHRSYKSSCSSLIKESDLDLEFYTSNFFRSILEDNVSSIIINDHSVSNGWPVYQLFKFSHMKPDSTLVCVNDDMDEEIEFKYEDFIGYTPLGCGGDSYLIMKPSNSRFLSTKSSRT